MPMSTLAQMVDPRDPELSSSRVLMMLAPRFNSSTATIGRAETSRSERIDMLAAAAVAWASAAAAATVACEEALVVASEAVEDSVVDAEVSALAVAVVASQEAASTLRLRLLCPRTPSPTTPLLELIEARLSLCAT